MSPTTASPTLAVAPRPARALPWPLPAIMAWSAGWGLWMAASALGTAPAIGWLVALLGSLALAWRCQGAWRRLIAGLGFPLSALVLVPTGTWPAWLWLLLALPLLAAYPLRAWRDAPLFPTPPDALQGLDEVVPAPASVLDAGCGLGHGLAALHSVWPQARLQGVEWSPLLARLAAWRCPGAHIRRGDMWALSWAGHDVVYLFQRPESMARAWAKARSEMRAGAHLVSLEFAVPDQPAQACLQAPGRRPVWVYAMPALTENSIGGRQGR
jgi:hypothetical protein